MFLTSKIEGFKVEYNFDGELVTEIDDISTTENLQDLNLYVKVGDKFQKLDDYLCNKLEEGKARADFTEARYATGD